jgi:hypothetical protein
MERRNYITIDCSKRGYEIYMYCVYFDVKRAAFHGEYDAAYMHPGLTQLELIGILSLINNLEALDGIKSICKDLIYCKKAYNSTFLCGIRSVFLPPISHYESKLKKGLAKAVPSIQGEVAKINLIFREKYRLVQLKLVSKVDLRLLIRITQTT